MLKVQEIREIIRLIDQSTISEFTYEHEGSIIKIRKPQSSAQETATKPVQQVTEVIESVSPVVNEEVKQPVVRVQEDTPTKEDVVADTNIVEVVSPMVGTFYRKPTPESDPYVQVGDRIEESSIVCIVEAMKLFNEIEAEVAGEIVEVLVDDGELVEYGQALYKVKTK